MKARVLGPRTRAGYYRPSGASPRKGRITHSKLRRYVTHGIPRCLLITRSRPRRARPVPPDQFPILNSGQSAQILVTTSALQPPHQFHHQACIRHYAANIQHQPKLEFLKCFRRGGRGHSADRPVMPLRNDEELLLGWMAQAQPRSLAKAV
jgi:hypothetical protein